MCAVSFSRTSRPLYVPCVWGYGSQCCYWHRCPFDRHNAHWTIFPFLPNEDSPRRYLFAFDPRTNFFSFPSRKKVEFRQTVNSVLYCEPLITRALLTAERVLAGVAVSNSSATLPWPPLALRQAEPFRPEERWTPNHSIATSAADRNCAVAASSHRDRSGRSERGDDVVFSWCYFTLFYTHSGRKFPITFSTCHDCRCKALRSSNEKASYRRRTMSRSSLFWGLNIEGWTSRPINSKVAFYQTVAFEDWTMWRSVDNRLDLVGLSDCQAAQSDWVISY